MADHLTPTLVSTYEGSLQHNQQNNIFTLAASFSRSSTHQRPFISHSTWIWNMFTQYVNKKGVNSSKQIRLPLHTWIPQNPPKYVSCKNSKNKLNLHK